MKFQRFHNNLDMLQTITALITGLNLSIIHWSLSENEVSEQIHMFQIKPCAEKQM